MTSEITVPELLIAIVAGDKELHTKVVEVDSGYFILFYTIVEGRLYNISRWVAEYMSFGFDSGMNAVAWRWNGKRNDFSPALWITGRISEKMFGDRTTVKWSPMP